MLVVGLTGGIGSGKSTVGRLLGGRGAVVLDTDAIAREVVSPRGGAYAGVVDRFGPAVVAGDGTIDRGALAGVVFSDAGALADLNALTHPAIAAVVDDRLGALAATDTVVVLEVPLLTEAAGLRRRCDVVVAVDCPEDVAVERLVDQRGMAEADARARVAAQATRDQRLAIADRIIGNGGSLEHLEEEVERTWRWLEELRRATPAPRD